MSVSKKRAAPRPPQDISNPGGQNKENETVMKKENGHGDGKTKVDEYVLLKVVLPNQKMDQIQIDSAMPLIDLRMQLCGKYKLSPSSYNLEPLDSDGRLISFTPTSTIASTNAKAVAVKSKSKGAVKVTPPKVVEQTVRLTIKMSRSSQQVLRVRPNVPLSDLLQQIHEKSGYKREKYQYLELRHPSQPTEALNTSQSLDDIKIRELIVIDSRAKIKDLDIISMHSEPSSEKITQKEVDTGRLSNKRGSTKLKALFRISKKSKHAPAISEHSGKSPSPSTSPQVPVTKAEELRQHPNFANLNENNSNQREELMHGKKKRAAPIHQNEPLHGQVSEKIDDVANTEKSEKEKSIDSNEENMEDQTVKKILPSRPTAPPRAKPRHTVPSSKLHATGKKKAPPPPTSSSPTTKARPEKPPRKLSVERNKERPQDIEKDDKEETDGFQDDTPVTKTVEFPPESPRTNGSSEKISSEADEVEDSRNDEDSVNSEEIGITPENINEEDVSKEDSDSAKISDVLENYMEVQKEAESPVKNQEKEVLNEDSSSDEEDEQPMTTSQVPDDDTFVIIDDKDLEGEIITEKQDDHDAHQEVIPDPIIDVKEELKSMDAEIKSESSEDEEQDGATGFSTQQPQGDPDVSVTPDETVETESMEYMNLVEKVEEVPEVVEVPMPEETVLDSKRKISVESSSSELMEKEENLPGPSLEDSDNLFTAPDHFDPYFGQKQANEGFDFMEAAKKMIDEFEKPFVEKSAEDNQIPDNADDFFPPPPPEVLEEKSQTQVDGHKPNLQEESDESDDDDEKQRQIDKLRAEINRVKNEKARKAAEEEEAKKNPYTIVQDKKSSDADEIAPGKSQKTFTFIPNQRKKKVVYDDYDAAIPAVINLSQSGEIRGIGAPIYDNEGTQNETKEKPPSSTKEKLTPLSTPPKTEVKLPTPPLVASFPGKDDKSNLPVVIKEKDPVTNKVEIIAPPPVIKEKEPEPVKDTKVTPPVVVKKDQEPQKAPVQKSPGGYVSSAVKRRPPNADKRFVPTQADLERDKSTSSRKSALPNYYMKFFSMKTLQSAAEDAKEKREKEKPIADDKTKQKIVENGEVTSTKQPEAPVMPVSPVTSPSFEKPASSVKATSPIRSVSPVKPATPKKPESLLQVTTSTPKSEPIKRTPSPISDVRQINELLNSPSIEQLPLPPEENYSAKTAPIKNNVVDDFPLPPPPEEFLTPGDAKVQDLPPPIVPPVENDHSRQSSDSSTASGKATSPIYSPRSPNYVGFSSAKPFSPASGGAKPQFRRMAAAVKATSKLGKTENS